MSCISEQKNKIDSQAGGRFDHDVIAVCVSQILHVGRKENKKKEQNVGRISPKAHIMSGAYADEGRKIWGAATQLKRKGVRALQTMLTISPVRMSQTYTRPSLLPEITYLGGK